MDANSPLKVCVHAVLSRNSLMGFSALVFRGADYCAVLPYGPQGSEAKVRQRMKDLPNSFWAAVFIAMACVLAGIAMFSPSKTDTTAVITMCASIITGAFGYIQGIKDGRNSVQVPLDTPTPSGTKTTVSVGTTSTAAPVEPPKEGL